MLNREELYVARIMFKSKVLESDGVAFEKLFTNVMQKSIHGFQQIKPQGVYGDRKNDGYIKETGCYYQVYAPEDLSRRLSTAVDKLQANFAGLKAYWDPISPIRVFHFVTNDKFKGTYPQLEKTLAELEKANPGVAFKTFSAANLEDYFVQLNESEILSIIGYIPDPIKIGNIDYKPLGEILHFLQAQARPYIQEEHYNDHDFWVKIEFNGLGRHTASLLSMANTQVSVMDDFYRMNSDFARQDIAEYMSRLYKQLNQEKQQTDSADSVFYRILGKIGDNTSKQSQDAALVVMSYYFENCDIFEEPP